MCCDHNVGLKFYSRLAKCKSQCTGLLKGFDFRTGKQVPPKKVVSKPGAKSQTAKSKVPSTKPTQSQPSKTSKTSKNKTSQTGNKTKGTSKSFVPSSQPKKT